MIILRNMRLNLIHKETKSLLVLTFLPCTYFSYIEPIFVLMLCGRRQNDRHVDQMRVNHIWSDNVGRWQSEYSVSVEYSDRRIRTMKIMMIIVIRGMITMIKIKV